MAQRLISNLSWQKINLLLTRVNSEINNYWRNVNVVNEVLIYLKCLRWNLEFLMALLTFLIVFSLLENDIFSTGVKFSGESLAEISLLAEKGKTHLESLEEKANFPQFGSCWKNAISDLQIGCKFLSENVQRDLALGFTDCFLQMSGHEPLKCDFPRSACLKKLSDRAFNAYTEFYTHTQSICYFLQSQVWHEETEKTINRLFSTSLEVSKKLEEAGEIQEKLLDQQKQSLVLQHDMCNSSKNVVNALQLSQDKINGFMNDFKSVSSEQKELLNHVFENLALFRSWTINELSWFSSTVYFAVAALISFLFTSVSRTRDARMIIFIIFALNYIFERSLVSSPLNSFIFGNDIIIVQDSLNIWIWFGRKLCICIATVILLYTALTYCDYNLSNYKLLLEIKRQNIKILNHFDSLAKSQNNISKNNLSELNFAFNKFDSNQKVWNNQAAFYAVKKNVPNYFVNKSLHLEHGSRFSSRDSVDAKENKSLDVKENNSLDTTCKIFEETEVQIKPECNYNLRSLRRKTIHSNKSICIP